ncbi:MAG TPA: mannose-1-phosphate guanylyltransferase [Myxococcaceae bacterium]|nr:mannose-1-phosphate guanylyltransferase [Myxococcaceae bacterium]
MNHLYPVIMAGGSGTRFWPLSRAARPKQFLPLASESPLFADTARRLSGLAPAKKVLVVCGRAHARSVRKILPKLPAANVIVEPHARNTAAAIGLATLHVQRRDAQGILAVLPSDHAIRDAAAFRGYLTAAARLAERGYLVTIGIRPTRPETGFGYIQIGEPLTAESRKVKRFVEKPEPQTAEQYMRSGEFLWNAGIFVFRADAIREAFRRHMPKLSETLDSISGWISRPGRTQQMARAFRQLEPISIDYGVMQKADNLAVLPADFGWSDLGSFSSIAEVRSSDQQGNVVAGKSAELIDCRECVVFSQRRPLALVGLSRMVVVDAGDVVLVVPREDAQNVRKAVQAFKGRGWSRYL